MKTKKFERNLKCEVWRKYQLIFFKPFSYHVFDWPYIYAHSLHSVIQRATFFPFSFSSFFSLLLLTDAQFVSLFLLFVSFQLTLRVELFGRQSCRLKPAANFCLGQRLGPSEEAVFEGSRGSFFWKTGHNRGEN